MIIRADARHIPLADETVQCVVTSPPYWGLRNYGIGDKGIGLESNLNEYIAVLVRVFREVWRVLKPSGTVWLNMGDAFAHNGACGGGSPVDSRKSEYGRKGYSSDHFGGRDEAKAAQIRAQVPNGLKPKDLMGIPWRVAFALLVDGWWLRSDIVWVKPNPMPESVHGSYWTRHQVDNADCPGCSDCEANDGLIRINGSGRPTRSHEYVFLLAKNEQYFYDAEAIKESCTGSYHPRTKPGTKSNANGFITNGLGKSRLGRLTDEDMLQGRNKRDVWTINSEALVGESHYAAFPQALVMPCILAGTSAKGECVKCGANVERVTETEYLSNLEKGEHSYSADTWKGSMARPRKRAANGTFLPRDIDDVRPEVAKIWGANGAIKRFGDGKVVTTAGWRATCKCNAGTRPNLVFDPFLGSGTTGLVAERLGRSWCGTELSVDYIKIAWHRTAQLGLFG